MAKDYPSNAISGEMHNNKTKMLPNTLTNLFGSHFSSKVNSIVTNLQINPQVYNRCKKGQ